MVQSEQIPPSIREQLGPWLEQAELQTLSVKPGHTLYRLRGPAGSFIIKWFNQPTSQTELLTYNLLRQLDIPTLPVHAQTRQALLLEDLQVSPHWRLAQASDLEHAATGAALAKWYRRLHAAGQALLSVDDPRLRFLQPWVNWISAESLYHAGLALGIAALPEWEWIQSASERLVERYLELPQTFNYNDFAAENLAVSRQSPQRCIVFDYDCFATGAAYSDYRNVQFVLRGEAAAAFASAWGEQDPAAVLLDEPLSFLHGLIVASRRSSLPGWARPLLSAVENGELLRSMRKALAA